MDVKDTTTITAYYEVKMKFVSSPREINSSANSKDLLRVNFTDTITFTNIP